MECPRSRGTARAGVAVSTSAECTIAKPLATALRAAREGLVKRWLDRIAERVTLHRNHVFPTEDLLDHVPLLIDGIADYMEDPADEITADVSVVAKAMELGELRHQQGFEAHQLLKEYEILGGILFEFLIRQVDSLDQDCEPGDVLVCAHRVFRAVAVIQQATAMHYLRLTDEKVKEREDRLRGFNRAVSHEMKNRIGAVLSANEMLREEWIGSDPVQREKFTAIIARNTDGMQALLKDLIELSRTDGEAGGGARNVMLHEAAWEVVRQLRDFAEARAVEVTLAEDLPEIEVPAAAVELCLSNYISNAVKYRDPAKAERWVRVEGETTGGDVGIASEVVVRVRDNGLGVPEEAREKLFERFFRAHEGTVTGEEGTGLGLSIVRETIQAVGGRAWAEFSDAEGSTFCLAFPYAEGRQG